MRVFSNSVLPRPGRTTEDIILSVNITSLRYRRRGESVLSDIHVEVRRNERLAIVGPNGSGKSTLLNAICQRYPQLDGQINLNSSPLSSLSRAEQAKQIAVLAQHDRPDLRLSLTDYVALGRIPHAQEMPHQAHCAIVTQAIENVGLLHLQNRTLSTLSGGERQKVALARVLAQTPSLLLLDEPTNHLDPAGRAELLALIKRQGITVIAVLHDLALADSFADRILLLSGGRQVLCDTPARTLISEHLYPVFGVTSVTATHPVSGKTLRFFDVPDCA